MTIPLLFGQECKHHQCNGKNDQHGNHPTDDVAAVVAVLRHGTVVLVEPVVVLRCASVALIGDVAAVAFALAADSVLSASHGVTCTVCRAANAIHDVICRALNAVCDIPRGICRTVCCSLDAVAELVSCIVRTRSRICAVQTVADNTVVIGDFSVLCFKSKGLVQMRMVLSCIRCRQRRCRQR
jgi:hypothetical protein